MRYDPYILASMQKSRLDLDELVLVLNYLHKVDYPKMPLQVPYAEHMTPERHEELIKQYHLLKQEKLQKHTHEVYNGYDRDKLRQVVLAQLTTFFTSMNSDKMYELIPEILMGMWLYKASVPLTFPKTSKVNKYPMPNRVPPMLEAYYRMLAIHGKEYKELALEGTKCQIEQDVESTGKEALPDDLEEFIQTAPYHWLEFWTAIKVPKQGEKSFPNTYIAALLFEQKFGYMPNFTPDSRLNQALKEVARPPIQVSWARGEYLEEDKLPLNIQFKKYSTAEPIFELTPEPPKKRPTTLW